MLVPNDVTSVAETIEFCFSELKIDKVIGITLDKDTLMMNMKLQCLIP